MDSSADETSMLIGIAHQLRSTRDYNEMIEGAGYVVKEGNKLSGNQLSLFSGITVQDDDPEYEYEER